MEISSKQAHYYFHDLIIPYEPLDPLHRYMYNYTLLQGLKNWLSRNDAILIVRVPYIFPGQTKLCSKFWALIPPLHQQGEAFHQQNMVLILLTDRDQLLSNDHKSFQSSRPLLLDELFEGFQQLLPSMISLPVSHMDFNPWTHIGGSLNAQVRLFTDSTKKFDLLLKLIQQHFFIKFYFIFCSLIAFENQQNSS